MAPGREWRSRSPGSVVDEIQHLQRQYGVERINFLDDEFIGVGRKGRERALAIGEEIVRRLLRLYVMPIDPYVTVGELQENLLEIERVGLSHFHEGPFLARLVVFKGTALEERLRREGLLRTPERGTYLGFLDYEFCDPAVRRLRPAIHRISGELSRANARLRAIFQSGCLNAEEVAFGVNLKMAINHTFLRLLRNLLTTEDSDGFADAAAPIGEMNAALDTVERARQNGSVARFAPCRFCFGGEVVEYPSHALRRVTETLASQLLDC
ncbi:MAG: hypothetical protein ABSG79_03275 [Bryobacteraceae bacterium]|jgi:hypothetical protein